jgi:hypothetical protein
VLHVKVLFKLINVFSFNYLSLAKHNLKVREHPTEGPYVEVNI